MAGKGGLAEQVRVGLASEVEEVSVVHMTASVDPLDELFFRKPIRKHVAEFGALFGAIAFFLTAGALYKGHMLPAGIYGALGALFAGLGYLAPSVLKPVWSGWMKLAHVIGAVMSTAILSLGWFLLIIPFALGARAFKVRLMDMEFRKNVQSYWEERDPKHDDFALLTRQY